MSEIAFIADQMKRAFHEKAWHGPSVLQVLEEITTEQAAARPIRDAHSIWEITLHIAAWKEIVGRWISGEQIGVTDEMEWPPVTGIGKTTWQAALERLNTAHAGLAEVAQALNDTRLDVIPAGHGPGSCASVRTLLHGITQHDLYHAGQIAVMRKAG